MGTAVSTANPGGPILPPHVLITAKMVKITRLSTSSRQVPHGPFRCSSGPSPMPTRHLVPALFALSPMALMLVSVASPSLWFRYAHSLTWFCVPGPFIRLASSMYMYALLTRTIDVIVAIITAKCACIDASFTTTVKKGPKTPHAWVRSMQGVLLTPGRGVRGCFVRCSVARNQLRNILTMRSVFVRYELWILYVLAAITDRQSSNLAVLLDLCSIRYTNTPQRNK